MIDLHIHSNHSDGKKGVIDILEQAEELGLDYISITDHDTCRVYKELENLDVSQYYKGQIIRGIEVKCNIGMLRVEILGYNIDHNKMQSWLDDFYKDKTIAQLHTKYFNQLYEICIKKGLKMDKKEDIIWDANFDKSGPVIFKEIMKHKENKEKLPEELWDNASIFLRKYTTYPEYDFYIDKSTDYPSIEEAVNAIHNAGGLAFLAHLYVYVVPNSKKLLNEIMEKISLDGLECYHSTYTKEQKDFLINFCEENNLLTSGGSDYHGEDEIIKLGLGKDTLNVPSEIVDIWYKELIICSK